MLQISNLTIKYTKDDRVLIDNLSFTIRSHDKIAIIGEEGNGKSTLLKWLYNPTLIEPYTESSGTFNRSNLRFGYLPQSLSENDLSLSIYDYMSKEPLFLEEDYNQINTLSNDLKLPEGFLYSDQLLKTLSGGEKIKVQVARIIISKPNILLFDEPTNDLDLTSIIWLEEFLINIKLPLLFISHDETLLENVSNRIIHIEQIKRKTTSKVTIENLSYQEYINKRNASFQKDTQIALSQRREEKIRMEKFRRIRDQVEHALNNVPRADPSTGRLLKKKMHAVKSLERRFQKEHEQMLDIPIQEEAIDFFFQDDINIPNNKKILDFHLPSLQIDNKILSTNINLTIYGPQRICIIGDNGTGKTTLLAHINNHLKQVDGIIPFFMPQNYLETLDVDQTPIDFLCNENTKDEITKVRKHLGALRYTTEEMTHKTANLSGGQQAKLFFIKMNIIKANVLLLDEPTRNFSPLSNPVIREMLKSFPGAIIAVSHDRKFINEVIENVYLLDKNGLHLQSNN